MLAQHGQHHPIAALPDFWGAWDRTGMLWTVVVVVLYLSLFGPLCSRLGGEPLTRRQLLMFAGACATLFLALASPLHVYGRHVSFSAHMLQMSLLLFVLPPLFLGAIPAWALRGLLRQGGLSKLLAALTNPVWTILIFNFLLTMYHLPAIFDTIFFDPMLHTSCQLLLLLCALLLWWPIVCPLPEQKRLAPLKKIAYIFAAGAALLPACAMIVFAGGPLYQAYRDAPQWLPLFTLVDDQQLGGILMKLTQELSFGFALWFAFREWYYQEQGTEKAEQAEASQPVPMDTAKPETRREGIE